MPLEDSPTPDRAMTVSQLLGRLGRVLDGQPDLQDLILCGEITNWVRSRLGHCYFSLKDDQAQVRCVLFRGDALGLTFDPADGMAVRVEGSVTLYKLKGDLQVRVHRIQADGVGALYEALERLRRRLEAEGLFCQDRKRPLPPYPRRVGVVTSREGAVLHDIRTTLARRNPAVGLLLAPSAVQGEGAEASLVRALEALQQEPGVDCIIIARGGGSLEDLMAFNSEAVVRAVAACRLPVISAVGHETDFTLCDLAADRRAPTPTAAAEIVAPARDDLLLHLQLSGERMLRALSRRLHLERERLDRLQSSPTLRYPRRRVEAETQVLDALVEDLRRALESRVRHRREGLDALHRALLRQHPQARLGRDLGAVQDLRGRLTRAVLTRLQTTRQVQAPLAASPVLNDPARWVVPRQERLQALRTNLLQSVVRTLEGQRANLEVARGRLEALSPLRVLERGYALVQDSRGSVVSSVRNLSSGDLLHVRMRDGTVGTRVVEVEEEP